MCMPKPISRTMEEVVDSSKRKEYQKPDVGYHSGGYSKGPMPFPAPPQEAKQPIHIKAEEKKVVKAPKGQTMEEKRVALCAYCKAMNLHHKCGAKWFREHRCDETVQLHVVEELWELF